MKVIVYGVTGMIGQLALRECLLDPEVEKVIAIVRKSTNNKHPKYQEFVLSDISDLSSIQGNVTGFDACLYLIGVSSSGMSEADYTRITYEMTIKNAKQLVEFNPNMKIIYVSGMGADSTEQGKEMWARVEGKTENTLLSMPFKAAYMLRPAAILPMHGVRSKTAQYRILYNIIKPINPLLKRMKSVLTSEQLGQLILHLAKSGTTKEVLEKEKLKELALSIQKK
ncbi:NAD-dependent epimerase/dehydratase family protein [Paenibacillus endoradicis]|uniref:NAD-dependent epimerase/dehydratase family protein n=1 Tax=Paenibacillus endoradicis TaxID=2972487 RepID=UPI002159218A|nr:NAD-dependent epimerase/dehydratase family protein [Paenibacillus endoradicis]MCR8656541.1 NAD-dependent epimerase/dehydratase family protein [Paenibacillus endoradicis]